MEDAATTIETGAELDSQPAETTTDSQDTETAQAEPAKAEKASKPDIKKLLEREKNDPNFRMNDAEQDVYDAYIEKLDAEKQKPKNKTTQPEPKDEDGDEETADEKPAPKPKEAKEEKEPEPEDEEKQDDLDPDAKALLKELGAKTTKEAHAKLKDLRKLVGGKDAQAVARLEKEKADLIGGQRSLWEGLQKGDPKAITFAEKTFGVKFAGKAEAQPTEPAKGSVVNFIDPDKFIDPESATLVNDAFRRQEERLKAFEERFKTIEEERDRHIQETVRKQSVSTVVDEMAKVAQRIPALKGLAGFREAAEGVLNGKPDPRLDVFAELFEIAKELGPKGTLLHAFDIKRGRDSDRIEAAAKEAGRKEAYNVKPNPSLSGATGGRGEAAYQPVTDAQLEQWESDHKTHPDSWYDANGDIIQSKVPKRAWKIFDFK
jgi:hypothetical protein